MAEVLAASPYRVLIAFFGAGSYAFLSPKNGDLWPDHETGCCLTRCRGPITVLGGSARCEMEYAGQHEMLNWMALIGAMSARPPSGNPGLHGDLHPGVGQMLSCPSRPERAHRTGLSRSRRISGAGHSS